MTRAYAAEGDSITSGGSTYANLFFAAANPAMLSFHDNAVAGSNLATMTARGAALDAILPLAQQNFLSVLIGANDSLGGTYTVPSDYTTALASYLDARRAAGWIVILCTITAQNSANYNSTFRNPVNAITSGWALGLHFDGLANFGADAIMGDNTSFADFPTYWNDGVHPSSLGQARLETIIASVINNFPVPGLPVSVGAAIHMAYEVGRAIRIV